MKPLLIDLFAGRLGWSRAFLERGWRVIAYDLVAPSIEIPADVDYRLRDILTVTPEEICALRPDWVCCSSPCEEFACFSMRNWQPNPKYPEMGIRLFSHARMLGERSGSPYVMENVRAAQEFVGNAVHHAGSFFLWGTGVPPLIPRGLAKARWYRRPGKPGNICELALKGKRERKAALATIPPELSACVAAYAERLLEMEASA